MGDSQKEGTDGAPTKPVSSLRSHFEHMSALDRTPKSKPIRLTTGVGSAPDNEPKGPQTPLRASLDIPRRSSPWAVPEAAASTQSLAAPGSFTSRLQNPEASTLQRPVSMSVFNRQHSPPLVTVDSPKSPPKSLNPSATQSVASPTSLAELKPTLPGSQARGLSSEDSCSKPNVFRTSILGAGSRNHVVKSPNIPSPVSTDTQKAASSKAMPPPINRADKPKILMKSKPALKTSGLHPIETTRDESVSPFSTPPSSPEKLTSATRPPSAQPDTGQFVRNNHPHAAALSPQKQSISGVTNASREIRRPSTQQQGSTQIAPIRSISPEQRPGLPPRRDQERGVRRIPSSEPKIPRAPLPQSHAIPATPRQATKQQQMPIPASSPTTAFLPPPKRTTHSQSLRDMANTSSRPPDTNSAGVRDDGEADFADDREPGFDGSINRNADYPNASRASRRPPYCLAGIPEIETSYDPRLIDLCGSHVCATGHHTRVWDVRSGEIILSLGHVEKEIKVTALAFKPAVRASDEGSRLWLGTNYGEIQEIDIVTETIVQTKVGAHDRRDIVRIYRHQNSMWSLDDGGKFCVWLADDSGLPSLQESPLFHRMPKGHTSSLVIQDTLWLVTGKEIRIFRPGASDAEFSVLRNPLMQPNLGAITSGATISGQTDRVYYGHADGKVSIYSTIDYSCLGVVTASIYKISSLAGAGSYLWAGFNTGRILVFDTRTQPWTTKKDWLAHRGNPVLSIQVDRSSLWKTGVLRMASLGLDNVIRFWDGTLENDSLEEDDMQDHDVEYCTFREISAIVVTWNAGAATPTHVRQEDRDRSFFHNVIQSETPPDLIVFGFQELVDLEDKKLTAKSFFKGTKKRDPAEQDHIGHQYRAWRDYLVRCIEDSMPQGEPYHLLHTGSMVGLFSCIFVKASHRTHIRNVAAAEIKRGMGGLHGNKGALMLRFTLDDTSICLINCHLAAGQTSTSHRNNDVTAILESEVLPAERNPTARSDIYTGGGDGSLILDSEICLLNGDMNYRIDTMGRDTVIKAVNANNLPKLLERDQLLVSRRRNPAFRIRAFREAPITFAPTYKYDVGTDQYDTSEKRRAPAWCDRILYKGVGNIKQLDYRRHELRVSDHRPVSGLFRMRIKAITPDLRARTWQECEQRFAKVKERLAIEAKIEYLRDVLGVPLEEARGLV